MTAFTPGTARIPSRAWGDGVVKGFSRQSAPLSSPSLDFVEYRLHRILRRAQRFSPTADFDAVKRSLTRGPHFELNQKEDDFAMSFLAEYDPLRNLATARLLLKDSTQFYLVTATIK